MQAGIKSGMHVVILALMQAWKCWIFAFFLLFINRTNFHICNTFLMKNLFHLLLSSLLLYARDLGLGSNMGQIGPKLAKSKTFSDQISVHFGSQIWKSLGFHPFEANLTNLESNVSFLFYAFIAIGCNLFFTVLEEWICIYISKFIFVLVDSEVP